MFEDEHLLEGGRCGSASHCETLSIAVASLSHQIILSQPPIAFTCSISLSAVFPLRTSPPALPFGDFWQCPWLMTDLFGILTLTHLLTSVHVNRLVIAT